MKARQLETSHTNELLTVMEGGVAEDFPRQKFSLHRPKVGALQKGTRARDEGIPGCAMSRIDGIREANGEG